MIYQSRAKNVFKVFLEIALEGNRDQWKRRMRRMGLRPCKQPGVSKLQMDRPDVTPTLRARALAGGRSRCGAWRWHGPLLIRHESA